jgi:hypothetical protein
MKTVSFIHSCSDILVSASSHPHARYNQVRIQTEPMLHKNMNTLEFTQFVYNTQHLSLNVQIPTCYEQYHHKSHPSNFLCSKLINIYLMRPWSFPSMAGPFVSASERSWGAIRTAPKQREQLVCIPAHLHGRRMHTFEEEGGSQAVILLGDVTGTGCRCEGCGRNEELFCHKYSLTL